MLPEKVSVTATMSVIRTGAQHMSAVACLKEVTCIVEAERKLIGFPCLAGEKGADGTSASVEVGSTTTLPAGSSATVVNVGTDQNAILNFGIPKGADGTGADPAWGNITGTLSNQTDLQTALNAKANTADLGNLAEKDNVDYATDITNKPTLGALASQNSIDYTSNYLTNKPTLGTMASVNDAASDSKTYGRKNGAWVEVTGGGGGSTDWGDIGGTLSNQTDLQDALDSKADITLLAEEFDPSKTYYTEDWCTKDGKLYQFRAQHTGAWDPLYVDERVAVQYLWNKYGTCAPIGSPTFLGTPKAPTPTAGDSSTKIATTAFVQGEISGKQDTLTFDTTPTASSTNPVTSDGIKTALDAKQATLTFDNSPTSGSSNPVKSSGVYTAIQGRTLHLSMSSTSTLGTISNSSIKTTMRVVNIVWGSPENVLSDVSWNTNTAGKLVLSGTLGGATTAQIDLVDFG